MKKIRLGFRSFSDGALLVLAQFIHAALTGNTYFPSPQPTLALFLVAINSYSDALSAAKNRGKNEVAAKNARKEELIGVLRSLALDLMKTADGNELMLISTGYPLTKTPQSKPPLGMPAILKMENGESVGEIAITLDKLPGALVCLIQYTQDPLTESSEWLGQNSSLVKATLTGLESGKKYWIRVAAYGTNNQVMVSDAVLSRIVQ